jgi:hypothetical protein
MNPNFWFNIFVLAIGWPIVVALYRNPNPSLKIKVGALIPVLLGIWGYTNFMDRHGSNFEKDEWYHHSEMWQYYLGSKYYKEVGNTGLYDATVVALREQRIPLERHPDLRGVRDLQRVFRVMPEEEAVHRFYSEVHPKFSEERWSSFKKDVADFFIASRGKLMLALDMGYNPPPPYSLLVGAVSHIIPITSTSLNVMASLDWILLVVCAWALWKTFGPAPTLAFMLVFLTNPLSNWGWVGGAYLRNLELTFLTLAVCLISRHRLRATGFLLGLATAIRIFPLAFFIGALAPFLRNLTPRTNWFSVRPDRPSVNLILGFTTSFAGLVLASSLVYGAEQWTSFLGKIWLHSKILFTYHIGFDKIAMPLVQNAPQYFDLAADSGLMLNFQNWQIYNTAAYNAHWVLFGVAKLLLWVSAFLLSSRLTPAASLLFLGEVTIFLFSLPANYYYMTLALFAASPFLSQPSSRRSPSDLVMWLPSIAIILLNVANGFWKDPILINVAYNWVIMSWLLIYAVSCHPTPLRALSLAVKKMTLASILVILAVGLFSLRPRNLPSTNGLFPENIFIGHKGWDVIGSDGWTQYLGGNVRWTEKRQMLVRVNEKTRLTTKVEIPVDGVYRVYLDYTTAPDYADSLNIVIGDRRHSVIANTKNVSHKTWESPPLPLSAGPLLIEISPSQTPDAERLMGISSVYVVPD